MSVLVTLFPSDSLTWSALGWRGGFVPGALVKVQRYGSSDTAVQALTDSTGVARFPPLLTGQYALTVLRVLDTAERARLGPASDIDAMGTGINVSVDTPKAALTVRPPISHRSGLVVSEYWFPRSLTAPPAFIYPFGGFLELYNSGDTTIYLDGLTFGDWEMNTVQGPYNSCTNYLDMSQDSTGLWLEDLFRFPGSGHDHPVLPGGTVVLATDAVDHRAVNDSASDLSGADFEFIGPSDVDNPSVPNMINVSEHVTPLGHGWYPPAGADLFLGLALNPDTLPSRVIYTFNAKYYHVARAASISFALFDFVDPRYTECLPLVSPVFDAAPAIVPYSDTYWPSFKRKVLRYLPDGRAVLQNTHTSAQDFEFTFPRTPGVVP